MKHFKGLFLGLSLFFLGACNSSGLADETYDVTSDDVNYTLQLPKGWETQKDYQEEYNEAAVFGGKDTGSNSYMFIRTKNSQALTQKELQKTTTESVKEIYQLDKITAADFSDGEIPVVKYELSGYFKKKPVTVYLYYLAFKDQVVNVTFYAPKDNNQSREKQLDETVLSIEREGGAATTDATSQQETKDNVVANDQMTVTLTGYDRIEAEDKQLVVIRYVVKNKQATAITPAIWDELVDVTQNQQKLTQSSLTQSSSMPALDYLLSVRKQPIEENQALESAVVYELVKDSQADVLFTFDQTAFPKQTVIHLPITK